MTEPALETAAHAPAQSATPASPPAPAGWSGAAMALHAIRRIPSAMIVSLRPDALDPLLVDMRGYVFPWTLPLEQFPTQPTSVVIGTHAFDGGRASWLRAGDRYRLYRWPEFEKLPITDEQQRIVKTCARGFMTIEKLAAKSGVEIDAAQRVANALSLMGLLRRHPAANAAPDAPPPPPPGSLPIG